MCLKPELPTGLYNRNAVLLLTQYVFGWASFFFLAVLVFNLTFHREVQIFRGPPVLTEKSIQGFSHTDTMATAQSEPCG